MKKWILLSVLATVCLAAIQAQEAPIYRQDELVIKMKSGLPYHLVHNGEGITFGLGQVDALMEAHALREIRSIAPKVLQDVYLLRFEEIDDIKATISAFEETGLFEYVEPNYIGYGAGQAGGGTFIPDDTHFFTRQYGLLNHGSFPLSPSVADADIDMEQAWDIEQGDESVIVAVLDAGVKMDHPEFEGRIWTNENEMSTGTDSDANGYPDDLRGWDFAYDDNDPVDDYGHGTNVAGIIAANGNNGIGYAGVDWNCKVMVCKILEVDNTGEYVWWAEAIYYAVNNGAKVINMSVGGSGFSNLMQNAVNFAHSQGVTIVACMMNTNSITTFYPAGYQNTIAVGATDATDQRASPFFWSGTSGSNYGNHIDVTAPGNYIYGLHYSSNTNYNSYWGGTSQAAPLVTGVAALLLAQDPGRTPEDIRDIIRATAEDQVGNISEDVAGFDIYHGYGRMNAYGALTYVPTAVVNIPKDPQLRMFPNPASDRVVVQSDLAFDRIVIRDVSGHVVLDRALVDKARSVELLLPDFHKGVYILQLEDKGRVVLAAEKLLIQ